MIDQNGLSTGVHSELITANDAISILGIRVLWTITSEYSNCQLSNLRVELNLGQHSRDITASDSSHSTKVGRAQLGNSLVHVHVQVVHKFEYCLCATWKLFGK